MDPVDLFDNSGNRGLLRHCHSTLITVKDSLLIPLFEKLKRREPTVSQVDLHSGLVSFGRQHGGREKDIGFEVRQA